MPNLVFAKAGFAPPGGVFFYEDLPNGVSLIRDTNSIESLLNRVQEAYAKAGTTPPDRLRQHVENYICERVPRGFCIGTYPAGMDIDFMTPQAVKKRSTELARESGDRRADPGTTLSRIRICGDCKANAKNVCLSCTGLTDWAVRQARRTKIGQDDAMGICLHDKILLSLLVSLVLTPAERGSRPENCWRHNVPNVPNDAK